MKKQFVKFVLVFVILALVVGALGWYQSERGKVVALGQKPSKSFCQVAGWLDYPGFNVQERAQCESIIHPKSAGPSL